MQVSESQRIRELESENVFTWIQRCAGCVQT
ncbi:hypothetical protein J2W49_004031 [Hydrogenophaga palleronii]|uniref:Uncharacterized protein n=1 Tax=Hydrogenophaga palleronii TaxID=65655 RepID=A0ABU1WRW9_9BURK|nr:hypothetical protein [Hydrogenophaga palleronii]